MMDCLAIDTLPIAIKLAAQVIQAKQQIFQNDRTETETDQILNGSVQRIPCWFAEGNADSLDQKSLRLFTLMIKCTSLKQAGNSSGH